MKRKLGFLILAFCLVSLWGTIEASAAAMTPYQNGYTWIAEICLDDPAGRTIGECIEAKCKALYGFGTAAFTQCFEGAVSGILNTTP